MDYSLSKHKLIRDAVVAELAGLTLDLPGGVFNARVKPFTSDETKYPVAVVFTGNDSAEYSPDEANIRRDYDVDVVIVTKGYDVEDVASGELSFIDQADAAALAVENALTKFRFTLDALIYRLKYLRSVPVIDEDGDFYTHVRILSYSAHSIEKTVGANV